MATRRAGTRTVNPPRDLAQGDRVDVALAELTGGPKNKKGYLRKFMPFDAVVVDSYTGSVRLEASVDGVEFDPVPENTARTFDSVPVTNVYLKNPSGSGATVSKGDIELILFTNQERKDGLQFSGSQVLADLIPGVK